MRKNIKTTEAIFPMPVLMIATYNEDGSIDVMNAAWGTMLGRDQVVLNLTETHKTVKNIKERKAFTVSIADAEHVVEADYFGIVSGNNTKDKFENSKLTSTKSTIVDAPIINEFPICMECEFIEYQDDKYGCGVIGKILNVSANENVIKDDKVDISAVDAIAFDPYTHGYYKILEYLRASGSMPFISKPVTINNKKYLDGGIADSIPIDKIMNMGFDKVIVVLTRQIDYQKKKSNQTFPKIYYKKYPKFVESINNRYKKYNEELQTISKLEEKGKILVIRPSKLVKIKRVEKDKEKIQEMYDLGTADALKSLTKINQFL